MFSYKKFCSILKFLYKCIFSYTGAQYASYNNFNVCNYMKVFFAACVRIITTVRIHFCLKARDPYKIIDSAKGGIPWQEL